MSLKPLKTLWATESVSLKNCQFFFNTKKHLNLVNVSNFYSRNEAFCAYFSADIERLENTSGSDWTDGLHNRCPISYMNVTTRLLYYTVWKAFIVALTGPSRFLRAAAFVRAAAVSNQPRYWVELFNFALKRRYERYEPKEDLKKRKGPKKKKTKGRLLFSHLASKGGKNLEWKGKKKSAKSIMQKEKLFAWWNTSYCNVRPQFFFYSRTLIAVDWFDESSGLGRWNSFFYGEYSYDQIPLKGKSAYNGWKYSVLMSTSYYLGKKFIALLTKGRFMDKIIQITCP